jgi:surfactin synthase thioesterase subunit
MSEETPLEKEQKMVKYLGENWREKMGTAPPMKRTRGMHFLLQYEGDEALTSYIREKKRKSRRMKSLLKKIEVLSGNDDPKVTQERLDQQQDIEERRARRDYHRTNLERLSKEKRELEASLYNTLCNK